MKVRRTGASISLSQKISIIHKKHPFSYIILDDNNNLKVVNEKNEVVYQGIAQRAFKQQFTIATDVIVQGADLINGLLTINLEKIVPEEKKPKTIEIKTPKRISTK